MRRVLLLAGSLVLAAAGVFAVGALASLDWARQHSAETAALPEFSPGAQGLVRVRVGDHEFRARVAGPEAGPALLLLHGFPETSGMWEPLLAPAAAAGFRVVAFDQRGYSPGARPEGVEAYAAPELIDDVMGVADAVGFERFHLVGHDWGCVIGWGATTQHPERVRSWAALSIPHPGALADEMRGDPPAYVQVFNLPGLAEGLLAWGRMLLIRHFAYDAMPAALREEYLAVFLEPGALTATLNWYRALMGSLDRIGDGVNRPVSRPTLFVYGEREVYVDADRLARQRELVSGELTELELDADHWLMQQQPDAATRAILAHLSRNERG